MPVNTTSAALYTLALYDNGTLLAWQSRLTKEDAETKFHLYHDTTSDDTGGRITAKITAEGATPEQKADEAFYQSC
tara:strand:+ start:605 stop:832 length:228 start_codon:yes stop_codon:yes gene_type:complete